VVTVTWLKLSDTYPDDMDSLSDAAFRCHTEALTLVMRREQGPLLPWPLLRKWLNSPRSKQATAELLAAGAWIDHGDTVEIVKHYEHQITPEQIAANRVAGRERARRHHAKVKSSNAVSNAVTNAVSSGLDWEQSYSVTGTRENEAEISHNAKESA
jgi:hypothetical protein